MMLHKLSHKFVFGSFKARSLLPLAHNKKIHETTSDNTQIVRNIALADEIGNAEQLDFLNKNIQLKDHKYKYNTFRSLIDYRRDQARNSLLVQVKSIDSANELRTYCNENIGEVKALYYHENETSKSFQHFFVVEFEDVAAVGKAMFEVAGFDESSGGNIPVSSPFMWFSSNRLSKNQGKVLKTETTPNATNEEVLLPHTMYQKEALQSKSNLNNYLLRFNELDDQIRAYYELMKITEVGTRLRFLACEQIELALTGMFPNVEALPFGSSVNSFGKFDSDLDMCLKLTKENKGRKFR